MMGKRNITVIVTIFCVMSSVCMAQAGGLEVQADGRLAPIVVNGTIQASGNITTNADLVVKGDSTVTGTIQATHGFGYVPIGSIIAWYCLDENTEPPVGWAKCSESVSKVVQAGSISDLLDGKEDAKFTPPLLNDADYILSSKRGLFLRGGVKAGVYQNDGVGLHTHGIVYGPQKTSQSMHPTTASVGGGMTNTEQPVTINTNPGGTEMETRPVNMSVIWIIRYE